MLRLVGLGPLVQTQRQRKLGAQGPEFRGTAQDRLADLLGVPMLPDRASGVPLLDLGDRHAFDLWLAADRRHTIGVGDLALAHVGGGVQHVGAALVHPIAVFLALADDARVDGAQLARAPGKLHEPLIADDDRGDPLERDDMHVPQRLIRHEAEPGTAVNGEHERRAAAIVDEFLIVRHRHRHLRETLTRSRVVLRQHRKHRIDPARDDLGGLRSGGQGKVGGHDYSGSKA